MMINEWKMSACSQYLMAFFFAQFERGWYTLLDTGFFNGLNSWLLNKTRPGATTGAR